MQIEYEPKHRLAGAIIIVVAAVLVVPILLPEQAIESRLESSQSESESIAIVTPLDPAPSSANDSGASRPALKPVQPTESTTAQTTAAPAQIPTTPPTAESGFEVQVGIYYDADNAAKVIADLKAHGYTAQRTAVQSNLGDRGVRIWLGPYAEENTAADVAARLSAITGERGYVKEQTP